MAVTAQKSLDKLTSSKSLEIPFKRTISRLYELTSKSLKMIQEFYNLQIKTNGQKLYEFTNQTIEWIRKVNLKMEYSI